MMRNERERGKREEGDYRDIENILIKGSLEGEFGNPLLRWIIGKTNKI
jgi:hypothetical protein